MIVCAEDVAAVSVDLAAFPRHHIRRHLRDRSRWDCERLEQRDAPDSSVVIIPT
jgi:hypothetical protein